jgi:hypothetical protein
MSVQSTLRDFVADVTGLTVLDAQPRSATAPRPPLPYATVLIVQSEPVSSTPFERTSDTPDPVETEKVIQRRSWLRKGTARVDIFGSRAVPIVSSVDLVEQLQLSIRRQSVRDILAAGGLTLRWLGSMTDIPTLRNVAWEDHSQADFEFRAVQIDESPVPWIETIEILDLGVVVP